MMASALVCNSSVSLPGCIFIGLSYQSYPILELSVSTVCHTEYSTGSVGGPRRSFGPVLYRFQLLGSRGVSPTGSFVSS